MQLRGREAETERIDSLLAAARGGRSGALLVRGEPGVGKTALFRYAAERAQDMTVLRAQGLEVEVELAFCALADLLRPVICRLGALPEPQAAALAGALGLGPAVPADRFLVCVATLSLLAAASEDRPVLVLVDDAQWVDAASLETILFAARRLEAEQVAILVAALEGEATPGSAGLDDLTLGGLDRDAAAELVAQRLGRPVAADALDRLMEATGGNPLALRELADAADALTTGEPGTARLPPATTVERAFLRRVRGLPDQTREGLLVAAADSGVAPTVLEACALLGLPASCLDPAEDAGVIRTEGGRIVFTHPLVRAAVYHAAPTLARERAHRALAEVLADPWATPGDVALGPSPRMRRAWQLAAATHEPDEAVASALEAAALEARGRSGYAAAAAGFERAARLAARPEKSLTLRLEAAQDWHLAGRLDAAAALLDEALVLADDTPARAPIQHLRGRIEMSAGRFAQAAELLATEAATVAATEPETAASMLIDAAISASTAGAVGRAVELARDASRLAEPLGGHVADAAMVVLGGELEAHGEPLDDERRQEVVKAATSLAALRRPPPVVAIMPVVLTALEEYGRARALLDGFHDHARAVGAPTILMPVLCLRSDVAFRTGDWVAAYTDAAEAVRLARETGQLVFHSLAFLARVEAGRGLDADCRAHAFEALEDAARNGIGAALTYAHWALGLLALGLGRIPDAIAELEEVARLVEEHEMRGPIEVPWAQDLVEAYVRSGHRNDAARVLARLHAGAERTRLPSALAATSRCHGLLAGAQGFAADFERALALHDAVPTPFERARTQLCFGERLRRARRRSEARVHLRAALDTFQGLDAAPWAARTRTELAAAGEASTPERTGWIRSLTPQELQLALIVGRGATNKEAAAALFVSPKTVEAHLHRIYVKLGIRSRTELTRLLAREQMLD